MSMTALILLAQPATAASADEPQPDAIIVDGALPVAREAGRAITPITIDSGRAERPDVERLLLAVPSLQQFRRADSRSANPSAQGLNLRGLGGNAASRAALLIDGVPQVDPFFGAVAFDALAASPLWRVSAARGADPAMPGALAGLISIDSVPLRQRATTTATAAAGSFDTVEADAHGATPVGGGWLAFDAAGRRSAGFETTPDDQRTAFSVPARHRRFSSALSAVVPFGSGELAARWSGFAGTRTLRFAGADSATEGMDASIRYAAGGQWPLALTGWVQWRDFRNRVVNGQSGRITLDQRATPSSGWGLRAELRPRLSSDVSLTTGLDWRASEGVARERAFSGSGQPVADRAAGGQRDEALLWLGANGQHGRLATSVMVSGQYWQLSGGFRRENRLDGNTGTPDFSFAGRHGWLASGRAGIEWRATDGLRLLAATSRHHRLPTLNELYRPFVLFPVTTRANAALVPERLDSIEAGAVWQRGHWHAALTLHDSRLANAIGNVTIAPNVRERRNLSAIRSHGFELEAGGAAGTLSWWLAASHQAAHVAGSDLRPSQVPRWSASGGFDWQMRPDHRLSISARHTGAQWEDDANQDRLPAATTIDAGWSWRLGGPLRPWHLRLTVENLFDARVVTRNAGGSIDLGAPRSVMLALVHQSDVRAR